MQGQSYVFLARLAEHPAVNRIVAGSNPAASVESSAIHSLVFRLRHRKADGMVIPILQVGMSWFDP